MKKYIILTVIATAICCSSFAQDSHKFDSKQFYTEFVEPLDGINEDDACGIIEDASTMSRLGIELDSRINFYKANGSKYLSRTDVLIVDDHFIKEFNDIVERIELRKDEMPKQYFNKMMNELQNNIKKATWLRAEYVRGLSK